MVAKKVVVLLLIALLTLGCAQEGGEQAAHPGEEKSAETAAEETVKIGVLGPMQTRYGKAMERGVMLAVKEINENGGILGKKVEVVVADSKLKPDVASTELRRLAFDENVDVIIGGFSSGVVIASMDTLAEVEKVWMVACASPTVTNKVREDYETYKYVFRVGSTNSSTFPADLVAMLDFLNEKGVEVKKVAVIRDEAKWVADIMDQLRQILEANGYEVVMEEVVPPSQEDFSTALLEAQSKADVIMPLIAHGKAASLVKQWKDNEIKIPLAGLDLHAVNPDYWDATSGKCDKEIYLAPSASVPAEINEKMKAFIEAYKKEYGVLPEAYSAYGCYDAVYVFKEAVERAAKAGEKNPFDTEVLIKYLESINAENPYPGVRGNIAFTDHHDLVYGDEFIRNYICQWQNGKQVTLYPKATGELIIQ